MQAAPGDIGALLSGLVTGDDGALTEETSDAFLSSGTTHITAISGANFAVLTMLLGRAGDWSNAAKSWFIGVRDQVIWLYALMVGLQPSAFRAALLATAVLLADGSDGCPICSHLTVLLASLQIVFGRTIFTRSHFSFRSQLRWR